MKNPIRRPLLLGALLATICLTTMGQGIVQNIVTTAYTRIFLRATTAAQARAILGVGSGVETNLNGVAIGDGAGNVTGTIGTAGYVPVWSATTPFLTPTSPVFVYGGTNVGVGTAVPLSKLDVTEDAGVGGQTAVTIRQSRVTSNAGETSGILFGQGNRNAGYILSGRESDYGSLNNSDSYVAIASAVNDINNERMRWTSFGNVTLGIVTAGTSAIRNFVMFAGTSPSTFPADAVSLVVKDQNGSAGNAALHIHPEAGATNIIGKWVQFPGGLTVGGTSTTDPAGKLRVGTGVINDGGGFKHARLTTGSINATSSALVTNTWTTAFADANYTLTTSVQDSTAAVASLQVVHIEAITATGVSVRVENSSAGALTGTLHLIAIHD